MSSRKSYLKKITKEIDKLEILLKLKISLSNHQKVKLNIIVKIYAKRFLMRILKIDYGDSIQLEIDKGCK